MSGRLLEIPVLVALALLAIAVLAGSGSGVALAAAAVIAAALAALLALPAIRARRLRAQARRRLDQAVAEHGLDIRLRQNGRADIYGGVLGVDSSRSKLAFASPGEARVADFGRVRAVSVGVAKALGQSTPSWYSIDLEVDGEKEKFSVATTSARQARKWLGQLGEVLGPERIRDALATLG